MYSPSIRTKLIIYSSAIIFLVALTTMLASYFHEKQQMLSTYELDAERIAQIIAPTVIDSLLQHNIPAINKELSTLKANTDIEDSLILDPKGNIIAEFSSSHKMLQSAQFEPFMREVQASTQLKTFIDQKCLVSGGPLKLDNGQVIGTLYIQFSLTKYTERLKNTLYINFLSLSICLMIGIILATLISVHFTKPIAALIQLTQKIGKGSEITFPKQPFKEFNVLGQALTVMVRHLYQTQATLKEATIELDNKVKIRTTELEKATLKAQEANIAKSQFLANVSHEIRTPMHGLIGASHLLETTRLNEEQRKYNEMIKLSADSLLNLINDILDFSKIEAGKLAIERIPFTITQTLTEVGLLLENQAKVKGLSFDCTLDPNIPAFILGDPSRLKQILLNLVNNALKFTSHGSVTVKVKLLEEAKQSATLHFTVEDTGIGIPLSKQSSIFEAFSQGDTTTTREYGGTGLGLAIAKRLTTLMGGQMGVKSEPQKGSTFWFTLIFDKYQQSTLPVIDQARSSLALPYFDAQNTKILVVDDNLISQQITVKMLEKMGFQAQSASNGEAALTMMNEQDFDMVFMDCQMPGMDGFETTKRLRSDPKNQALPIIALTASASEGDKQKCLAAGMTDYLAKPINVTALAELLQKYCSSMQQPTEKKLLNT
ncbi:MAG: ATP-binding protein [Candidatus Berkiellales bacterium]